LKAKNWPPTVHITGASLPAMPVSCRTSFLLLLLFAGGILWPSSAWAQQEPQLNRCTGRSGNTIYTDRPCDAIGASERLPRSAIAGAYGLRRGGCARNLQDLIYEITAAIDSNDVNRLGSVYHWIGHSPESGYRVLDQLQAIADRPLVDIVALRGAAARAPAAPMIVDVPPAPASTLVPPDRDEVPEVMGTETTDTEATVAEATIPRRVVRRPPVGLRLEQTTGKSGTPSRTVFGLRRHLDCWWITL
jgi:hypothetical protein